MINILDYLGNKAYEEDPFLISIILPTLQTEISHLTRTLDDSGLSKLISSEQSESFLRNFSFSAANIFQEREKAPIERVYGRRLPDITS